jgi:hypothetical protein
MVVSRLFIADAPSKITDLLMTRKKGRPTGFAGTTEKPSGANGAQYVTNEARRAATEASPLQRRVRLHSPTRLQEYDSYTFVIRVGERFFDRGGFREVQIDVLGWNRASEPFRVDSVDLA